MMEGHYTLTGSLQKIILKVRARKKVSIPLEPEKAPLFKYVN